MPDTLPGDGNTTESNSYRSVPALMELMYQGGEIDSN